MGTDPSTGASYSSELAAGSTAYTTLGNEYATLENQFTTLQGEFTTYQNQVAPTPPPTPPPTPTPPPHPATVPSALQSSNLTNLTAELKKDSQGTTAGDKASVITLDKQIAAVKARS
jgi:hypothetical protein